MSETMSDYIAGMSAKINELERERDEAIASRKVIFNNRAEIYDALGQAHGDIDDLKKTISEERKKHVVLEQKFFVQQNERDEAREKHGCVLTVRECRAIVNRLDAQETYGEVNHFSFLNAFDKLQKGANVEVKQEILDA